MKKTLLTICAAALLSGCASPKPVPTPPLPPGYKPPVKKLVAPKHIIPKPISGSFLFGDPIVEEWTTEKLYVEMRPQGIHLLWLTNAPRSVLMTATNLTTPMVQWTVLGTYCNWIENDRYVIQVTNRYDPQRFYRLLSAPTNSLIFSWLYDFKAETNVVGFTLYEGPQTGAYNRSTNIQGQVLWSIQPSHSTNRLYYALSARDALGVPSALSNEVNHQVGDPPNQFSPPCP